MYGAPRQICLELFEDLERVMLQTGPLLPSNNGTVYIDIWYCIFILYGY